MIIRRFSWLLLALAIVAWAQQRKSPSAVNYVKAALTVAGTSEPPKRGLSQFRAAAGTTPEYIEALSWIGRGRLARHDVAAAEQNAAEVRKLSLAELTHRKLDAEPHLPIALGAAIEVEARKALVAAEPAR